MLDILNLLRVKQRICYNCLIIVYKIKNYLMQLGSHSQLTILVRFVNHQQNYNVKNKEDFINQKTNFWRWIKIV